MVNFVKSLWKEDKKVSNAWITIPGGWTAELIAEAGYDAITIDAQHGFARDISSVLTIFQAIRNSKSTPLVRVPWNDPAYMMAMLDAGAMGIICPMINTAEETASFVNSCLYPPLGYRSYGPLRAKAIYTDYDEKANEEIITMAMIETKEGYENIEAIAATSNLTGLFLGPWDLSISMGLKEIANFDGNDFKEIFAKIFKVCEKNNLKTGVHCTRIEDSIKLRNMGFDLVTVFNDSRTIQMGAIDDLAKFKA